MTIHFGQERVSFNLVRLRKGGNTYEIVVDPDKAIAYREGENIDIDEILKSPHIFSNAHKGELAPETEINKDLGVSGDEAIIKILKEGEIQFTEEYRKKLRERRYNQIIDIIHKNAIDARTKMPIPPERIKLAMEEAKVRVDLFKDVNKQVEEVLEKIRKVIPIKIGKIKLKLKVPPTVTGKIYGWLKRDFNVLNEQWNNDGSLSITIEIPSGMKGEVIDELESKSHGGIEVEIEE